MRSLGVTTLFRRQLLADRSAALTVAAVVLVVATLLAAWPRALDHTFTEEVREQVTETPGFIRDVSGQTSVVPPPLAAGAETSADRGYDNLAEDLAGVHEGAPPLVREILREPDYQLLGSQREILDAVPEAVRMASLTTVADPDYADHVRLVEGEPPSGVTIGEADDRARIAELQEDPRYADLPEAALRELDLRPRTLDILLSEATAERLEWPVGQARQLRSTEGFPTAPMLARLTGVYEPDDADAAYWSHGPGLLRPEEEYDPNFGTSILASGFVAPTAMLEGHESQLTAQVWYPVDGSTMRAATASSVLGDLRAFIARSYRVGLDEEADGQLRLRSGTIDRLEQTLARQASATALVALVAAGPFGVALAVLGLGAKLVSVRRRRAMALVAARGASRRQQRALLAVEGAILGLPPAALAVAAVAWLVPGRGGMAGIALPVAVGLAPAVLLPVVVKPRTLQAERTDLGRRRRRGWLRWALESSVVGSAVASVVVLNRRGLVAADPGSGADPLLAAAPLIVALAVAVIVLRLYPLLVAAVGRLLKRRGGAVAFVGTVRAVRDPAAGVAPVLALVVGLAIAVFSTVLWSTTQSGGVSSSVTEVGGDLRAAGPIFTEEQARDVGELTGVSAAVTVTDQGSVEVRVGDRIDRADVYITDTTALATVQAGLTGVTPIPDGLDEARDGVVPAMIAAELGEPGDTGSIDRFGAMDIAVADVAPRIAGVTASRPWVLLDRDAFSAAASVGERPPRLLLAGADGDDAINEEEISRITGSSAQFTTATDVVAEVRSGAVGTGLMASFVVAVAVVGLLSALAVLLTVVIEAPARGRLLSQLRTLGLTGRQAQALAVWEMAPPTMVSLVCGAGLGVGLPWFVFSALDLRPLTGADSQPPVTVDWLLVSAATGVFVVIVSVAVVVAVLTSRRLRLGTVLRVGEEL